MKSLFLGAGSSYELGLPLVWELTAEIKNWLTPQKLEWLNNVWKSQGGGRRKEITELLNELLSIDSMHYEDIIGAIEVETNRCRKDPELYQELHGIRAWLLDMIYAMLYQRQVKNEKYIKGVVKDLGAIKSLASENKPLWIFSLNHDINIEIIAAEYAIPVKSGFSGEITIPEVNNTGELLFEYLSREDIDNNNYSFFKSGEYGINLIKLHGSLDIFANGDELNYLKLKPDSYNISGYISSLVRANENLQENTSIRSTNEIIFKDKEETIQFLRKTLLSGAHKFSGNPQQIAPPEFLKLFESYINYSTDVICVGYGFGDAHIDSVIKKWLSFSEKRRLNIVNPSISNIDKLSTYSHLSRQISFTSKGFVDYMLSINHQDDNLVRKGLRSVRAKARDMMKEKIERGR